MIQFVALKVHKSKREHTKLEIDFSDISKVTFGVIDTPIRISTQYISGTQTLELLVDGSDFSFYLIKMNLELSQDGNSLKLSNP